MENINNFLEDELSIIDNRRVRREMYYFLTGTNPRTNNFDNLDKAILFKIQNDKLEFYLDIKKNYITLITVGINDTYPFRTPNVLVNGNSYHDLLKCMDVNNNCLCCSSIICHNNWNVHHGIIKILKEIYDNYFIVSQNLKRDVEKKLAKIAVKQIFGHYLPIVEFL